MIYLDNAATTWPKPEEVYQAHDQALRAAGNPGRGTGALSLAASRSLLGTRRRLGQLFNIEASNRIVFTKNVTEALNIVLKGTLVDGDHVVISPFEHNSVVRVLEYLRSTRGISYSKAQFAHDTSDPDVIRAAFAREIQDNTVMICTTHASNVLGTIMPIRALGQLAREKGLTYLVDVAQTAGVLEIDVEAMQIDLLAFTGHKGLLGPQGTGGLYVREGIEISPLLHGGTGSQSALLTQPTVYPDYLESGTNNTPGIGALGAGVDYVKKHQAEIRTSEIRLCQGLLDFLLGVDGVRVYGPQSAQDRVGLVAFNHEKIDAGVLSHRLERDYEILTRTGLHCAPGAHELAGTIDNGAVRISFGPFNSQADLDKLIMALRDIFAMQ